MKTRQFIRLAAVLILWGIIMPPTVFSEDKRFVHRANRDTVNWVSSEKGMWWMTPNDTDIEWPGEQLGLIGPIIAHGGSGKDAYIAVYDPAGVLVGAIRKKEAKKNPERLKAIIRTAQKRAAIQNQFALISIGMKAKARNASNPDTNNQ
jgi:hypothetical protein